MNKKFKEEDLKQLFLNRFDCYADTNEIDSESKLIREGDVVPAITSETFIMIMKELDLVENCRSCNSCFYSKYGKTSCDRHLNDLKPDYSKGVECGRNFVHYRGIYYIGDIKKRFNNFKNNVFILKR